MSPLELVLAGIAAIVGSGGLALALGRAPGAAVAIAAFGTAAGGALGLAGALVALGSGWEGVLSAPWRIPGGEFMVGLDPLSAFFLAPVFGLGALCALYGRGYLGARVVPAAQLGFLVAAMALVLVARQTLCFLVAWEAMTLLAYLLITVQHGEAEVRRAGWVFLIASHVAVSAIIALFLLLGGEAGELRFLDAGGASEATDLGAIGLMLLALLGFGIKAGVAGLHVWLPEAHAAAPSHVSALMSGALIKVGIYGLLRTALALRPGAWYGLTLLVLGVAGALLGIVLALYQRDLKRILAYSSVENVGIVLIALGLGLWARAQGDARSAAIAIGAGLLHVWNHAAMKGLLFFGAGSVLHGAGTKDVEQLGGLLRRMPWTGRGLILGAVAISALPPLNGFAGEWLLYQALARVGMEGRGLSALTAIASAAALAFVGGLAVLCFVRLVGVVLLGSPRGDGAAHAHESPSAMLVPMACLAAACLALALASPALVAFQAPVLFQLTDAGPAEVAAAADLLRPVVLVGLALLAAGALAAVWLGRRVRGAAATETWGCGYTSPTPRMQYTARAFAELATTRVLPRRIQPRLRVRRPEGLFATSAELVSDSSDPLTRGMYEPFLERWGRRFARLRFLQQGNVHIYILYILVAAIAGVAWVAARDWSAP